MRTEFKQLLEEYQQLTEQLSNGGNVDLAKLGKRQAELLPIVERIEHIQKNEQQIQDNLVLLDSEDEEIRSMAAEENEQLEAKIVELTEAVENELIAKDPNDTKNAMVEIRAGAGGDESTLFAAEMFRAYGKYAESLGWKISIVSDSRSDVGGFKEIIFEIRGNSHQNGIGPYGIFKYESGVHRVQRVPETEKSGRVHTSTITIAVMPELEEQDYSIDPKDLKIETTTSQGNGGQSVNTTYSAVRITHLPTGITAQCQDERSQSQNKVKALNVIRARVADHYRQIDEQKLIDNRRSQIGSGDRSEKIRTYNFPQDRVTDHRLNQNFNQISLIMEGEFGQIINELQKADLQLKKESLK